MWKHAIGVVATFVGSIVLLLALGGHLTARPPFLVQRPAAPADSVATAAVDSADAGAQPAGEHPETAPDVEEQHGLGDLSPGDSLLVALSRPPVLRASPDTSTADLPAYEDGAPEPPAVMAQMPLDPKDRDAVLRLVRVYSKMKPKQAARILDSLADAHTLAILTEMNERVAAKVIAGMDPSNAARLSELMAQGATP